MLEIIQYAPVFGMIRASELPLPLAQAFLDALEAWGMLEHDLFMLWQFLKRSPDIGEAWNAFSRMSTEQQRKRTAELVREHLSRHDDSAEMPPVFDRLPELTKKRDRLVHGRWRRIAVIEDGKSRAEYLRVYDARGERALPHDEADEATMLGRSRFYEQELREAQRQFIEGARDLHFALAAIVTGRAPSS